MLDWTILDSKAQIVKIENITYRLDAELVDLKFPCYHIKRQVDNEPWEKLGTRRSFRECETRILACHARATILNIKC